MRPRGTAITARRVAVAAVFAAAVAVVITGVDRRSLPLSPALPPALQGERGELQSGARTPQAEDRSPDGGPLTVALTSPSAGWEDAAGDVLAELQRVLDGRVEGGAYADARAEAARRDLALFPPPRDEVRRLLRGSARDRTLALAALAVRPDLDDDLLRLVLRSQRPADDDVVRLLGAEIAAAVPAELAARQEVDLLRAFEEEPNPLVLAVALPALERMESARLRALLRAQAGAAGPEMLPVLIALSRDRLGAADAQDVADAAARTAPGAGASR